MKTGSREHPQNLGLAIRLHIHQAENSHVLLKPLFLETEIEAMEEQKDQPYPPLPYFTDAIVGLSAQKLLIHSQETLSSNEEAMAALLWQRLEPMHEVYHRSLARISPLLSKVDSENGAELKFEQSIQEIVRLSCTPKGTDLREFFNLIDSLNYLESKRSQPLLFDTQLQLSASSISMLHTLYSLLYNLRALVAIHHNLHCKDSLYEALQIDSVKDYFQAPDLLTNETLLYYHYTHLKKAGAISGVGEDSLSQAFRAYLPHSHYLVQCLPDSFFQEQAPEQLEQSLFTFQMDWLLGSPAGLLYRIREELFGLKEGYEHTFWPELQNELIEEPIKKLVVHCVLGSQYIRQIAEAA